MEPRRRPAVIAVNRRQPRANRFAAGPVEALRYAGLVRIRPIEPSDREVLRTFYAHLSEDSRRTRFFGPTGGIATGQATFFCTLDHHHREGFVATAGLGSSTDRIVGHLCIEPDGRSAAEFAVAVADSFQRHGVGRRLVRAGLAWARREGVRTVTATTLADNPAIGRLLSRLGMPTTSTPVGANVVEVRIELSASRSAA